MKRAKILSITRAAMAFLRAVSFALALVLLPFSWLMRDGMGPYACESSGVSAVARTFMTFNLWAVCLCCALSHIAIRLVSGKGERQNGEPTWNGKPNGCSAWGYERVVVENFIHALIALPILSYICYEVYSFCSSPCMNAVATAVVLVIASPVWLLWLFSIYVVLEPLRRKLRWRLTTYSIVGDDLVISLKCLFATFKCRKPIPSIKESVVVCKEGEYYTFVFGRMNRWIDRIRLKSQKYSPSSPLIIEMFEFCRLDAASAVQLRGVLESCGVPLDDRSDLESTWGQTPVL